ncbi:MAG TPA: 50S ribosomal protein L25 [Candidatus Acetothermia bacterium]|nr:50S ribosomal protein L25 [Candidatus Acetothermia bacterium]
MSVTLNTKLRSDGKANALRREGLVPAIVYGPSMENIPLVIERRDLHELFSRITRSSRIELSISDHEEAEMLDVFVKRVQYNPITDEPIHVDFYHPDPNTPLKLHVPIKVIGEAPGQKAGGFLNVLFDTVRVYGLSKDIPHLITLDISELEMGEGIRVRDVDFGDVTPLLSPERALVTIVAPRGMELEEEEEEEEMLETAAAEEGAPAEESEGESEEG